MGAIVNNEYHLTNNSGRVKNNPRKILGYLNGIL
jgi:hypothetical protein